MIDLTRSLDIAAPTSAVWEVLADYRRDPTWRPGVVSMEPECQGLVVPGTVTHEVLRIGGRTDHVDAVIDDVDPGRRLTWHTVSGADARGFRLVEPLGGARCRATLGITVVPHGAERLLVPMYRRMLGRNLAESLERLRALVEPQRAVLAEHLARTAR